MTSEDQTGAPQRITLTNYGTALSSFTYADAPAGNVTSESDPGSTSSSPVSYTYDVKGQVTSATPGTSGASSFVFDQSGNLTTLPNGASGTYDAAQELNSSTLSGTTTSYTYEANGNRTGSNTGGTSTSSATWTGAGTLSSYSSPNADMSAATSSPVTEEYEASSSSEDQLAGPHAGSLPSAGLGPRYDLGHDRTAGHRARRDRPALGV